MITCSKFGITSLRSAVMAVSAALLITAPALSETIDSRLGKLEFEAGYPVPETIEKLYDELDFQRAVQTYLWALPMASYGG